jgi:hypothetical protein
LTGLTGFTGLKNILTGEDEMVSPIEWIGVAVLAHGFFVKRKTNDKWWKPGAIVIAAGVALDFGFALYLRSKGAHF